MRTPHFSQRPPRALLPGLLPRPPVLCAPAPLALLCLPLSFLSPSLAASDSPRVPSSLLRPIQRCSSCRFSPPERRRRIAAPALSPGPHPARGRGRPATPHPHHRRREHSRPESVPAFRFPPFFSGCWRCWEIYFFRGSH